MLSNARKRKQEDDKETFEFRGQEHTEDTIRQRLQRKKLEPEKSNVAAGSTAHLLHLCPLTDV